MDPSPLPHPPNVVPIMRIQLWLETEEGMYFGMGRAQLLEKIRVHGSLKKAAAEMGMSYRAAWGKIRKTESVLGEKIIRRSGNRKDGHELTPFGEHVTEIYNEWFHAVEGNALLLAGRMFPWPVRRFREADPAGNGTAAGDAGTAAPASAPWRAK